METWKPVTGYEGLYEVSNLGDVRTCEGKTTHSERHGTRVWEQRVLKQKTDKGGYKRVTLWKDKVRKDYLVHRLVATEFCQKDEGNNIINHLDGNPSNNHYTNLEWCNHRENLMHAFLNGMNPNPEEVKLTNKETNEEKTFYSMAEASRFLKRNPGYISAQLKKGKTEADGYLITTISK